MLRRSPLRFLSIDLFRTLIFPKEHIAKSYADFGRKKLGFDFECANVANAFLNAFSTVDTRWPNFGNQHNISSDLWWNEVIIKTFLQSSPLTEVILRRVLTRKTTSEIYDWFSTDEAWELETTALAGLEGIANAGIDMCILSNSDERTPKLVESLKLDNYFEFVCFSASCPYVKPEREIFHFVARRFLKNFSSSNADQNTGTFMEHYAHVGDSVSKDYWGAVNAGCGAAFLFKRPSHKPLPNLASNLPPEGHSNLSIEWAYFDPDTSLVPAEHTVSSVFDLAQKLKLRNESTITI